MPSSENSTTISSANKEVNGTAFRLAVLMLAAGEGSRAGFLPKTLLKKNGETLLNYFCEDEINLSKSNKQICDDIKSKFLGKDVLFLTQSN